MFDISFERRGRVNDAAGEILIGEHRTTFLLQLSFWEPQDYRASWRRAAALVLEQGFGRFILSADVPPAMFDTWCCWREGDEAVLQHSILLPSLTRDFSRIEDAEAYLSDFPVPEAGAPPLPRCSIACVADFERRLRGSSAQ